MINDPIVEEIHETRGSLLAAYNNDLDALLDHYKLLEQQEGDRIVTSAARREGRMAEGSHRAKR